MSLTFAVTSVLAAWLAASVLSALRIRPFSARLAVFRFFIPWRMFALPVKHFHTLEYLDGSRSQPTWIVAASTRSKPKVLFFRAPTDLMAEHLYYATLHLETAYRDPERATLTAVTRAIELNLQRHPAVRSLSADRARSLRVVRRHPPAMAEDDLVVREWARSTSD